MGGGLDAGGFCSGGYGVNEYGPMRGGFGGQVFVIVLLERLSEGVFVLRAGAGLFPGCPVSGLADNRA